MTSMPTATTLMGPTSACAMRDTVAQGSPVKVAMFRRPLFFVMHLIEV